MIDLHAHVVPGVDDGPRDEAAARRLLACLAADGVREVVATPHALDGRYNVSSAAVLAGVDRLAGLVAEEGLELAVHPGAEVVVQPDLAARVRDGDILTLANGGKYLLIEMSFHVVPPGLGRLVFELQLAGVEPLIAHPERTLQVQKNPAVLEPLVAAGALLQLNASSVVGELGRRTGAAALALVDRGLAHVVASDAHDAVRRGPRLSAARQVLARRVGEAEAARMTCERPRRILAGEPAGAPGGRVALKPRRRGWRRVWSVR